MIVVAQITAITDDGFVTIGVSDAPYKDLTSTPTLSDGLYLPVINQSPAWSEHSRHPFQEQSPGISIGDMRLINTSGRFDGFSPWRIEVQRGPDDAVWNTRSDRWDRTEDGHLEAILIAHVGQVRWAGRNEVVMSLESTMTELNEPFAREVFDADTPNDTLINTIRPRPIGRVFQVRPPFTNPSLLRYYFDGDAGRVAEGGNPTENWLPSIDGIQLTQNPQQVITLDGAGPLLADEQRDDVLEAIGSFDTWTGSPAMPDGWTLYTDPPDSDFEESTGGGMDVTATFAIDDNTADTAANAQNPEFQSGANFEPVNAATLAEALETADDGKYVRYLTGSDTGVKRLWLSNFGVELPPDTIPVGVQLRIRYQSVGTSSPHPYTRWRLGKLVDGSFEAIMPFSGDYADFPFNWPTSWETKVYGESDVLPFTGLTREQVESEQLAVQITFRRVTVGTVDVQIDHVELLIHYGPLITPPKAVTTDALLTTGELYTLRVIHDGAGSVRLRWATVDETTDPVVVGSDPYQPNQAQLDGPGTYEALVTATGPRLALEFDRGSGNGLQAIPLVQLIERGQGLSRYNEQVPYIVTEMGLDDHVDQAMINAHDDATGHLPLGWYVDGSDSADLVLFRLAGSLGGPVWPGLDARVRSFLMLPPSEPTGDHLTLEDQQIGDDVEIWDDDPPQITDRAVGAKNQHPIPESGLSTITSTWTESERQAAMAEWRVTRKAQFPGLTGFEPVSGWSVDSIDPSTGAEAGDTAYTITGNFRTGEAVTVMFGSTEDENATVTSATTIEGTTPAGTGAVDVVVTQGEDSVTLVDGFEYVDFASEVIALSPTGYWKLDDASGTTATDYSGNDRHGTYQGSPTLDQPPIAAGSSRSAHFTTSDYVLLPDAALISGSMPRTQCFLVRIDAFSETTFLGGWGNATNGAGFMVEIGRNGDGTIGINMHGGNYIATTVDAEIDADTPHLIIFSWASNTLKGYVDDRLVLEETISSVNTTASNGAICRRGYSTTRPTAGNYSDYFILDREITAQEISDLVQSLNMGN